VSDLFPKMENSLKASEMSDAEFNAHLSQAMEQGAGRLKLTEEERKNFNNAMNNAEFTRLMKEYMDEISDPKNRHEQEEYLKQLERDEKVPERLNLVHPKPAFCIKAKKFESGKDSGKLFINACTIEEIGRPQETKEVRGSSWEIPYSLGPMRQEHDRNGQLQPTCDFAVHPETVQKCQENPRFQQMVIGTALEAVEVRIKDVMKEGVSIDRSSVRVLKGLSSIGGNPAVMQLGKSKSPSISAKVSPEKNLIQEEPNMQATMMKNKPNYSLIHRGNLDLGDFVEDGSHLVRASKRPKELVVRIQVPKLKSAKFLDIETSSNRFILKTTPESAVVYNLELDLPYPVIDEDGKAKFDKSKRTLEVVLPVQPADSQETILEFRKQEEESPKEDEEPIGDEAQVQKPDFAREMDGEEGEQESAHEIHEKWVSEKTKQKDKEIETLLIAAKEASKLPWPKENIKTNGEENKEIEEDSVQDAPAVVENEQEQEVLNVLNDESNEEQAREQDKPCDFELESKEIFDLD